jgi:hypothetical protein
VRQRPAIVNAVPDEWAERERRDVSASTLRRDSLVEDDEDNGARQRRERGDVPAEPRVARCNGAIVHVVAEIRNDERERRQYVCAEVGPQLRERDDVRPAFGARRNLGEVEERIVLLRVEATRRAGEPGVRDPFGIRLPRLVRTFECVRDALTVYDAVGAVARNSVRRAGDEREVVRQARMRDRVVAVQRRVATGKHVERRRVARADHVAGLVVLEHDDDHVVERRNACSVRRRCRNREDDRGRGGGARQSRSSSRFLPKWTASQPSTSAPMIAAAAYSPYRLIASAAAWPA